jgi:hypothetical protein
MEQWILIACNSRIMGTPNETTWPGLEALPDYKTSFPQWSPQDLARVVPTLDKDGLDILNVRNIFFRLNAVC